MLRVVSAAATANATQDAIDSCLAQLLAGDMDDPDYVMAQADARHDLSAVGAALRARWPQAQLHLTTSCLGSFTEVTLAMGPEPGLCLFAMADPEGDFGTACGDLGDDPRSAAAALVRSALLRADRMGETPTLVWVSSAPGSEEDVIAGVQDAVGDVTPIVGGSAGDNEIAGAWRVSDGASEEAQGLVVSVMFLTGRVGAAFHSGYAPTNRSGIVTRCEGRRVIEIDHRPAAQVYSEWTDGMISVPAEGVENVLMNSAFSPLGRTIDSLGGTDVFVLSHPETVGADGSMTLFTRIEAGDRVVLMSGSESALVQRPLLVTQAAMRVGEIAEEDVAGVILVYCAGCMLAVQSQMETVRSSLADALPGAPLIAAFTFGEQGPAMECHNRHGNLMISSVVFSR